MKRIILIISSILLLSSCINEERIDCPCFLSIDFSQVDTTLINDLNIWFTDSLGRPLLYDSLTKEEFANYYEIDVPKGSTNIYCWGNITNSEVENNIYTTIKTPDGISSDNLYFYEAKIKTSGEFGFDTVSMKRNFSGIYVNIEGEVISGYDFILKVESSSSGYYISGEILEGKYDFKPTPKSTPEINSMKYAYYFNILKQKRPDDLILTIAVTKDGIEKEIAEFPLGSALSEVGIDLSSEKMGDVYVTINYSLSSSSISIDDWSVTHNADITI